MSPEYSAWLRENPTLLALIVVAVVAGVRIALASEFRAPDATSEARP